MKTHQTSDPKMEQHPSKITPKIDAKKGTKKWGRTPDPAECAQSPNPIISKDILRQKTNEESRLKGEYRVECKKWSAKGTYRKASADREPTTHVNTLGGQRPRADSKRERAFRRARFFVSVGLWVCGYGCLLCCVVARSDAKPSCMLCCGVVGLWCVCVCVCVFYWPRGSQKAPKICFVRQLLPKPNKNGTKIDHK